MNLLEVLRKITLRTSKKVAPFTLLHGLHGDLASFNHTVTPLQGMGGKLYLHLPGMGFWRT